MTPLPENLQLHREDLDECDLSSEEESVPEDSVQGPSARFVERGQQNKDSARGHDPDENDKDKNKKENQNQKQDKGTQLPAEPTGTTTTRKRTTDKPPPNSNPNKYNVQDVLEVPQSRRGCIIM